MVFGEFGVFGLFVVFGVFSLLFIFVLFSLFARVFGVFGLFGFTNLTKFKFFLNNGCFVNGFITIFVYFSREIACFRVFSRQWRAIPVTVLGLVGGAPVPWAALGGRTSWGRHRASPIHRRRARTASFIQHTSF